jgi:hypothetical protein
MVHACEVCVNAGEIEGGRNEVGGEERRKVNQNTF